MTTYLARLIGDKQLVGIFTVEDDSELFWLVDECCNPYEVEIIELGTGGVYWEGSDAPTVPAFVDQEGEGGFDALPEGASLSAGWKDIFQTYDGEQDNGEAPGWKPVPHE